LELNHIPIVKTNQNDYLNRKIRYLREIPSSKK